MIKFLRKYNKIILVVGGSLLMIVFLLPQAVQQFGRTSRNAVWFTADGETFHGRDQTLAYQEFQALNQMQQVASQELGMPLGLLQSLENLEHWVLLTHEAKKLGMLGGPADGLGFIEDLAQQAAIQQFRFARATPEQQAQTTSAARAALYSGRDAAINGGAPADFVDGALAKVRAINRMASTFGGFADISAGEAALLGREAFDTAIVDLAVIQAEDLPTEDLPEPTEAEIAAQFEALKDTPRDEGELGFGYQRPAALKLEILRIDATAIRSAVVLDPIEVNRRWRREQTLYGADFNAARSGVESIMRDERVNEVLRAVEDAIHLEGIRARKGSGARKAIERGEDSYLILPDDWDERRPSFERLAEIANNTIAKELESPSSAALVTNRSDTWLTREDTAELPMGRTRVQTVRGTLNFDGFIFSVRELDGTLDVGLQRGVTFGPLAFTEQTYYVRITEVRPAGPPPSVDMVRDQVREDLLTVQRYARITENREELRSRLVGEGSLRALFEDFPDLLAQTRLEVSRNTMRSTDKQNPFVTDGNTEQVRQTIVDTVAAWDPLEDIDSIDLEERVVAVEIPAEQALALAIIKGRKPITLETLRQRDSQLMSMAIQRYGVGSAPPALSFASVSERLQFKAPQATRRAEDDEYEEAERADGATEDDAAG